MMPEFKELDSFQHMIKQHISEDKKLDIIKKYYKVRLIWSSNALEENMLTESETSMLLNYGMTADRKLLKHAIEAIGHDKAFDYMFTLLKDKKLLEENILYFHKLLYENTRKNAGKYISDSEHFAGKEENIQNKMNELYEWITKNREFLHPINFGAELHRKFVFIHPFKYGNSKVARLLMNTVLIQDKYLPVIIYPEFKDKYFYLLEEKDSYDFIKFIAEKEIESQKKILKCLDIQYSGLKQNNNQIKNNCDILKILEGKSEIIKNIKLELDKKYIDNSET